MAAKRDFLAVKKPSQCSIFIFWSRAFAVAGRAYQLEHFLNFNVEAQETLRRRED